MLALYRQVAGKLPVGLILASDFQSGNFSNVFSSEPCGPWLTKLSALSSSYCKSVLNKNDQLNDSVFWAGEAAVTNLASLCSGGPFITGGGGTLEALCVDVDVGVGVGVGVGVVSVFLIASSIRTKFCSPAFGNPLARL